MDGLVDLHAHLLPGLDDGPPDVEQALEMARSAFQSGLSTLAVTPHLRMDFPAVSPRQIALRYERLCRLVKDERIPLRLVSGAEASLVWALEASDSELRMVSFGARGRDLLIETPLSSAGQIEPMLDALVARGYRVTLAHPERTEEFQRRPELLEQMVRRGVLLQLNARSVTNRQHAEQYGLTTSLLRQGLVHAIASDAHRAREWRSILALPQAVPPLRRLVGAARAGWLVRDAPRAILEGAPLPPMPEAPRPSAPVSTKRRFLRRPRT